MSKDACIIFPMRKNQWGYGQKRYKGEMRGAHRVAYCEHHGISIDSIKGLVVRHRCDNPSCVNPEHLVLGTQADNMKDKKERGRDAKGEGNGASKLNAEIVRAIRKEYVKGSSTHGQYALAEKYGIAQSVVFAIVNRITWTHIEAARAAAKGES